MSDILKKRTVIGNSDKSETVNHPDHYKAGQYECIYVMVEIFGKEAVVNFCLCNAFKYLYRCRKKNGTEDLHKAAWYLNKIFALKEGDNHDKA